MNGMDAIIAEFPAQAPMAPAAHVPAHLPGFDPLRVLAALAVVYSHSILLATGAEDSEPFQAATGEILGVYGVFVFFMLSGYLVTDSALRSKGVIDFALKRIRRIFPAFVVAALVGTLVVAPLYATGSWLDFLKSPATWDTLVRVLTFQDSSLMFQDIAFYTAAHPGQETMRTIVNGVLWTIPLELLCYVLVAVLLLARLLRPWSVYLLAVAAGVFAFRYDWQPTGLLLGLGFVLPSFIAGLAARVYLHGTPISFRVVLWSATGLVGAMLLFPDWSKIEQVLFPALMVAPMLWIGRQTWGEQLVRNPFRGRMDPSYGIYIWGWMIEQVVLSLMGPGISPFLYTPVCLVAAFVVGGVSWYWVEAPFLSRRRVATAG
jgi:peptidoglycan/LPS O-acetylase OafA/YrhL